MTEQDTEGSSTSDNCLVPAAIPDDGSDDTCAIMAALQEQNCAKLAGGVYNIVTPDGSNGSGSGASCTGSATSRTSYILQVGSGQRLWGAGAATTLAFSGSANGENWYGIQLIGNQPEISDLYIDTTAVTDATDDDDAIQVQGPSSNVVIDSIYFNHHTTTTAYCIRLKGEPAEIEGLRISNNELLQCAYGVEAHDGAHGVRIENNGFLGVTIADISSQDNGDKSDWTITGNSLLEVGSNAGPGMDLENMNDVVVTGNVVVDRGFLASNVTGLTVAQNTFIGITLNGSTPNLLIQESVVNAEITGNYLWRGSGSQTFYVISTKPDGASTADHVDVSHNQILQYTDYPAVLLSGASDLTVADNDVYLSDATGAQSGLSLTGYEYAKATDILLRSNRVHAGSGMAAIDITNESSGSGFGRITAIGNVADSVTYGLYCDIEGSGSAGPIVSAGNNWPNNHCTTTTGQ